MRLNRRCLLIVGIISLALSGCHRYLVETPTLLRHPDARRLYAACPVECQSAEARVLYATDRAREGTPLRYGFNRSPSLAFGVAEVRLKPDPSWGELIEESTTEKRARDFALQVANVQELGRVPQATEKAAVALARHEETEARRREFGVLLQSRLAKTAHKDVYIFVHGFNNTFDDAVFRTAEVWHFMGRVGVPIAYTWPAGRGGIRGYAYDRESGEYTVGHLRRFIQAVADCPDVERIHLVAHSRGCDVTISALRELHLMYSAQGKSTRQALRLDNLVLAAPDVDEDVFLQRFVGEGLLHAAQRTTIYASGHDRAIELTDLIFASRRRLGMLAAKDINPKMRRGLANLPNVQFIECKLSGLWIGHSYAFTHPAALSDLILVLRDRRPPGAENGRPLRQPAEGIWELTDDYLTGR